MAVSTSESHTSVISWVGEYFEALTPIEPIHGLILGLVMLGLEAPVAEAIVQIGGPQTEYFGRLIIPAFFDLSAGASGLIGLVLHFREYD